MVLGSPLTISVTQTMMALLLTGIVCAGTDTVVRLHPRARKIDGSFSFVTWTVPALTTALAGGACCPSSPRSPNRAAGYVVTGLLLVLLISAEYVTIDPADRRYPAARFLLSAWATSWPWSVCPDLLPRSRSSSRRRR